MKHLALAALAVVSSTACFSLPDFGRLSTSEIISDCAGDSPLGAEVDGARSRCVLVLTDDAAKNAACAEKIRASGAVLSYWIDVARAPALADAHPEWMTTVYERHGERPVFADAPLPGEGEVLKVRPWVPVTTAERFKAQLERVRALLAELPPPTRIYLSGLQDAPWGSEREPIHEFPHVAADDPSSGARFVAAVQALEPWAEVVPVLQTMCAHGMSGDDFGCRDAVIELARPLVDSVAHVAIEIPFAPEVDAHDFVDGFRHELSERGHRELEMDRVALVLTLPSDQPTADEWTAWSDRIAMGVCLTVSDGALETMYRQPMSVAKYEPRVVKLAQPERSEQP
ncbi:MAG: hypothetical protein K8S98_09215 [Planctomycetes bacterium]|nr:hypothetical protein [Planctomycetota bacterium]